MAAVLALSLKQPWATLLAHGLKTIEVRSWPTRVRGRVLIHAARIPDPRPEGWQRLPDHLYAEAQRSCGGIVGEGELTACRAYYSVADLLRDQAQHLNEADWFRPPALYGLHFRSLRPLPFHPCPGQARFFRVELPSRNESAPTSDRIRLLVSVRSVPEAEAALAGGADLIDVKEPSRGALGRADDSVVAAIAAAVAGRRPVSAALGEQDQLRQADLPTALGALQYVKWGLQGCWLSGTAWRDMWYRQAARIREAGSTCRPVLVAYADWQQARAPDYEEVSRFALQCKPGALLVDTWNKDGSTLLDCIAPGNLRQLRQRCRIAGVPLVLAGSLGLEQLDVIRQLRPDWLAVRGAACTGGRNGIVDAARARALVEQLAAPITAAEPAPRRRRSRPRRGS